MFCFIDYIANNIKKIKVDFLFIALEKGKRGSKLLALMLLNLYDVRKNMHRQNPDDSNPLREKNFPSKRIYGYTIVFINITFEI